MAVNQTGHNHPTTKVNCRYKFWIGNLRTDTLDSISLYYHGSFCCGFLSGAVNQSAVSQYQHLHNLLPALVRYF